MKKKLINRILYSLIFMLINIVLLSIGLFTEVNNLIMDSLYQKEQTTNPDIKIKTEIITKSIFFISLFSPFQVFIRNSSRWHHF